jgi:hypothetical protein
MSARLTLDVLEVKNPCAVEWETMFGDGKVRFCEHCQKNVHNLSAMSADEAERLICESAGILCVRYHVAEDGQVVTLDYRPPPPPPRWRLGLWTTIALIVALLTGMFEAIVFGSKRTPMTLPIPLPMAGMSANQMMGEVMPAPPPPPAPRLFTTAHMGGVSCAPPAAATRPTTPPPVANIAKAPSKLP